MLNATLCCGAGASLAAAAGVSFYRLSFTLLSCFSRCFNTKLFAVKSFLLVAQSSQQKTQLGLMAALTAGERTPLYLVLPLAFWLAADLNNSRSGVLTYVLIYKRGVIYVDFSLLTGYRHACAAWPRPSSSVSIQETVSTR